MTDREGAFGPLDAVEGMEEAAAFEPLPFPTLAPQPQRAGAAESADSADAAEPPAPLPQHLSAPSGTLGTAIRRREAALRLWDEVLRTAEAAKAGSVRTAGPKAPPKRVADELGFVLHAWPWRESSLVADVLSLRYGRVFLIAKGAKRQASPLRGLLVPFAPLRLAWAGRNEGKVLIKAEWMGTLAPLSGEALLSGFYMNEMLVKLTEREDPHPKLFGAYVEALHALGTEDRTGRQRVLRRFELALLEDLGWGLTKPAPVEAKRGDKKGGRQGAEASGGVSGYVLREGALVALGRHDVPRPGEVLWDEPLIDALLSRDFKDARTLRAARDILREAVAHHLGSRTLHARRILGDLARL
ncbi:MAG: DNA repair protein RecO [Sutterella parvirubra]|nr:DNA repair protein RecO [Sutterella parvirubra]MDY5202040.1 DNA repair protein RecO [Sutterella parvirubra]